MEYVYKKIDAFTDGKSLGNPAACIQMKQGEYLTDDIMLEIAKHHQGFVSEVVFCSDSKVADCKLVYYSSECEVEFCGHGTIATMYEMIKNGGDKFKKDEITIETNRKGILPLYYMAEDDAVYITAPTPEYLDVPVEAQEIAAILGVHDSAIDKEYPIGFIDAGLRTLIVPFASYDEEVSIFPNEEQLKVFCIDKGIDIIIIFCNQTNNSEFKAHTRVFAPKFGYLEDPATGSGSSSLGYYMYNNKMWNGDPISLEQGGNNRVYNTVKLLWKDNKVLFGGRATTRINGLYYV